MKRCLLWLPEKSSGESEQGICLSPHPGILKPHHEASTCSGQLKLTTSFKAPNEDDYDGVDVTYINELTWAEETVQCRLPDKPTPVKVENFKLDGVLNQDCSGLLNLAT